MKIISLIKGKERFEFRYEIGDEANVLDAIYAKVLDSRLNFDWFDATVLSHNLGKNLAEELKPYFPKGV